MTMMTDLSPANMSQGGFANCDILDLSVTFRSSLDCSWIAIVVAQRFVRIDVNHNAPPFFGVRELPELPGPTTCL